MPKAGRLLGGYDGPMCGLIMVALLALFGLSAFQVTSVGEAEPIITPAQGTCPVTLPNGMTPPGEEPAPTHHGNGLLYTVLAPAGKVLADDGSIEANGSIGWKYPVWRALGVGEAGDLAITGHELTTGTAVRSVIPDGYGQRFQASGIYFPGEGCYELTLRSGPSSLTFITVVNVADAPWAAAP